MHQDVATVADAGQRSLDENTFGIGGFSGGA